MACEHDRGQHHRECCVRGYIYALVNSSMPGLIKVGKTIGLPSERVAELSSATGVPTPFVVAFEQLFEDCDAAEAFIHTALERLGLRPSASREFFRAPAADVIRLILSAPQQIASFAMSGVQETSVIAQSTRGGSQGRPAEGSGDPWDDLMVEAYKYLVGA